MNKATDDKYASFRKDVQSFLREKLTPEIQDRARRQAGVAAEPKLGLWWQKTLHEKGWTAPAWPVEYGGTGWDAMEQYIFQEECALAGAPNHLLTGVQMCGPVIMQFGSPSQKEYFLPRILSGEDYWCQGFSEPGSGSDLASLKTKAVRDGDDYVVNGSKIWTTHAHYANWIFLLVRTSTEGRPQAGISLLLSPMNAPGISVRPILSMSGEHDVNEVFFDNVRIPVSNRVGEENQGWTVAKYLLEFERGGAYAAIARNALEEARRSALQRDEIDQRALWDEPSFRRRFADLEIQITAQAWTERRVIAGKTAGTSTGPLMASVLKVRGSELQQTASEIAMHALGEFAIPDQRDALEPGSKLPPHGPDFALRSTARYMNSRATSIVRGTNEIQRNLIARLIINQQAPLGFALD